MDFPISQNFKRMVQNITFSPIEVEILVIVQVPGVFGSGM
jgi:hypothetical protein